LEDVHRRDVHYELDVLTEKTEYYWINPKRIGNLGTSIWAVNGKGIKVSLVSQEFSLKWHQIKNDILQVFTNLITGDEPEYDDVVVPEPNSPVEPTVHMHKNRPYSLKGLPSGHAASTPLFTDNLKRWRTSDVKTVIQQAVYIPLDFYPLCRCLLYGLL
jgi:hypothetical protein